MAINEKMIAKILMLKGEQGTGVKSVKKTGTSGLKDTYTITLTDNSTYTYEVTNGNGIVSIAKTSTSGLKDTYTVTLTDGSTTTFVVTNGGSIKSIEKTGGDDTNNIFTVTQTDGSTVKFNIPSEKQEILSGVDTKLASGYKKIAWSTITIATTAWSNKTATVSVSGVTADNAVDVAPSESSYDSYTSAGIRASAQGSGTLTFTCKTVPTVAINVNVKVYN